MADSANELTLLNILRARDRQPMHFTSMNVLRGNAQLSINASVEALLDDGDLETIGPSLGAGAVTNPSFDIAIYDKQEFQQGIMRPVEPSLYQYFLTNGWPRDYLARLLVERIEFRATGSDGSNAGTLVGELDNNPQRLERASAFDRFLARYDITIRSSRAGPTPLADASELLSRSSLSELSLLVDGPVYMETKGEHAGKLMRRGGVEYAAELVETDPSVESAYACNTGGVPLAGAEPGDQSTTVASFTLLPPEAAERPGRSCTFNGVPVGPPLIVLRSPDAVMYFLGEYLRAFHQKDEARLLRVWRESEPAPAGRRPVVRTRFMGERYAIYEEPDDSNGEPTGRSMQTLAFVQQLINLHKSAQELPASASLLVQQ